MKRLKDPDQIARICISAIAICVECPFKAKYFTFNLQKADNILNIIKSCWVFFFFGGGGLLFFFFFVLFFLFFFFHRK